MRRASRGVVVATIAATAGCSHSSHGPAARVPRVSWPAAERLISDCKVKRVEQTHRRTVTLTLRTGGRVFTHEPRIDDVIHDMNHVAAKCPPITLATE